MFGSHNAVENKWELLICSGVHRRSDPSFFSHSVDGSCKIALKRSELQVPKSQEVFNQVFWIIFDRKFHLYSAIRCFSGKLLKILIKRQGEKNPSVHFCHFINQDQRERFYKLFFGQFSASLDNPSFGAQCPIKCV